MNLDREVKVGLSLMESGTLCHLLMRSINESGGPGSQPEWVIDLYEKLAKANDKLMGKSK